MANKFKKGIKHSSDINIKEIRNSEEDLDLLGDWMNEDVNESSFIPIDRDKEDENVLKFQKTGDTRILEEVYLNRVQTLEIWAGRYYYLSCANNKHLGSEDMFSELLQVFLKAVNGYKKRRKSNSEGKSTWLSTPFNTYLWYSITNYVRNLKSGARAKKRRSIGYEGPLNSMVLSFEEPFSNSSGSDRTLQDIISNDLGMATHHDNESIHMKEILKIMSKDDPRIHRFLTKLSGGYSLASAIQDCKTVSGRIRLDNNQAKKLGESRRYNLMVSNLISDRRNIKESFKVLDYSVNKRYLHYSIELKKTEEADFVMKMVRLLKKNKDKYANLT